MDKLIKICTKCGIEKLIEEFFLRKDTKKYRNKCKDCFLKYHTKYRKDNRERIKQYRSEHKEEVKQWQINNKEKCRKNAHKYNLKKYNITTKEYNRLSDKQNGCCAICGIHRNELKRILGVDHNHDTGKIRGLLCTNCNHGLGKFNDNVDLLIVAIRYLRRNNDKI